MTLRVRVTVILHTHCNWLLNINLECTIICSSIDSTNLGPVGNSHSILCVWHWAYLLFTRPVSHSSAPNIAFLASDWASRNLKWNQDVHFEGSRGHSYHLPYSCSRWPEMVSSWLRCWFFSVPFQPSWRHLPICILFHGHAILMECPVSLAPLHPDRL